MYACDHLCGKAFASSVESTGFESRLGHINDLNSDNPATPSQVPDIMGTVLGPSWLGASTL